MYSIESTLPGNSELLYNDEFYTETWNKSILWKYLCDFLNKQTEIKLSMDLSSYKLSENLFS